MSEIKIWQDRQAEIDTARAVGALAAELTEYVREYGPDMAREQGELRARHNPILADLVAPMIMGDAWEVAARYGVAPAGKIGTTCTLDLRVHAEPAGASPGCAVEILREGVTWTVEGIILQKAEVYVT